MQPVINNKYFLTSVLMSNEGQDVVLCRRSSGDRTSLQKYLINVYKDRSVIADMLPDLQVLKETYRDQYIEHFVDGSNLHVVFRHTMPSEHLVPDKKVTLEERMEIADNLFKSILSLHELPLLMVYKLLNNDNIVVSRDRNVYFSNIFNFSDNVKEASKRDIVGRTGKILLKLFSDLKKVPVQLSGFIGSCLRQEYASVAHAYSEFKLLKKSFESIQYEFKKNRKLFRLTALPFGEKAAGLGKDNAKLRRAIAYTMITCFLATCGALFIYHYFSHRPAPAAAVYDIYIPEPVKEEKPAPEPTVPVKETPPPQPQFIEYTVKRGDTLIGISMMFYGDPESFRKIVEANGIENPNLINPGQVLKIPDPAIIP